MSLDGIRTINIPIEELENVDELFFRQLQMKEERARKKFGTLLEEAREEVYRSLTCEGIFDIFRVEKKEDEAIHIEGGDVIKGKMTAGVFAKSDEIVICAATVHGYDELESSSEDFMKEFIYDAWGTTFAECAFSWLKKYIKENIISKELYSTCSWSPGQHKIDIKLQKVVFHKIEPERIGVTLNDSFMMHPKKTVSGFFGVGTEKNLELVRACDFCELRETCPSAYGTAR